MMESSLHIYEEHALVHALRVDSGRLIDLGSTKSEDYGDYDTVTEIVKRDA